jgi:hypothetical protein
MGRVWPDIPRWPSARGDPLASCLPQRPDEHPPAGTGRPRRRFPCATVRAERPPASSGRRRVASQEETAARAAPPGSGSGSGSGSAHPGRVVDERPLGPSGSGGFSLLGAAEYSLPQHPDEHLCRRARYSSRSRTSGAEAFRSLTPRCNHRRERRLRGRRGAVEALAGAALMQYGTRRTLALHDTHVIPVSTLTCGFAHHRWSWARPDETKS